MKHCDLVKEFGLSKNISTILANRDAIKSSKMATHKEILDAQMNI